MTCCDKGTFYSISLKPYPDSPKAYIGPGDILVETGQPGEAGDVGHLAGSPTLDPPGTRSVEPRALAKLNNLTDRDDAHVRRAIIRFLQHNKVSKFLHVELWEREAFHEYFKNVPRDLLDPIDMMVKPTRGFFSLDCGEYWIELIFDDRWVSGLKHEFTHLKQMDKLGFELYEKCRQAYENDRKNDMFEIQAYLAEEKQSWYL